jgi:glycosyltransferase involved in cell wall biosynthesis
MHDEPWVTVVIPVHNGEDTVGRAIHSVQRQDDQRLLIIVIDVGSSDDTVTVVNEIMARDDRVCLLRLNRSSGGPGRPRNVGLAAVTTPWVLFLDDDDELQDSAFAVLTPLPGDDIVHGDVVTDVFATEPYKLSERHSLTVTHWTDLLGYNRLRIHSAIVSTAAARAVNGFATERAMAAAEDWHFWLKLSLRGYRFRYVDEAVGSYFPGATSISADPVVLSQAVVAIFEDLTQTWSGYGELRARLRLARVDLAEARYWQVARRRVRGLAAARLLCQAFAVEPSVRRIVASALGRGVDRF